MRTLLMIFFCLPLFVSGQMIDTTKNYFYKSEGFSKKTDLINYINDLGRHKSVKGYSYGLNVNNKPVGLWEVKNSKNELIGLRIAINDSTDLEIQIKNDRVFSISTIYCGAPDSNSDGMGTKCIVPEIISFDKKGRIRSKVIYSNDSVIKQMYPWNSSFFSNDIIK